jgi:energy-coupling factor transport system ATP-binding protein
MISFRAVSVTYPDAAAPALVAVDLEIVEGELALVVGSTGSGKSTLLRCVNGLVPHFTGGRLDGHVTVAGRDTRTHRPRDLADVVGYVDQDPSAGFVTDVVEDELAYAMESLGLAPSLMRRRVEETLDLLGLADIRYRPLRTLSAGQKQRVAIGSVLTAHPSVLVMDEPTSALDPQAAEEVLAAVQRLVHDLGMTVLMSEHRLERAVQYADRVLVVDGSRVIDHQPAQAMAHSPVIPPVVALGRLAGWDPLPLTVRDARRDAEPLRRRLAGGTALPPAGNGGSPAVRPAVVSAREVTVRHPEVVALRRASLSVAPGEVVALMGRNGAGKTTMLRVLAGVDRPESGRVRMGTRDPAGLRGGERVRAVGLVPQNPRDLLWTESVAQECRDADRDAETSAGTSAGLLARLQPELDVDLHPGDLSEGQRLAVALAVVLAGDPAVLLLDEPTRGLDYATKRRLVSLLRDRAASGTAVVLATHDVELAAEVATRVVILAEGEVVADGPARESVMASPVFAPQVAKVLAPLPFLTVEEVSACLAGLP